MTGPTHRFEPRQRLAVGTELQRCRQAARCRELVATGPRGLDLRSLGAHLHIPDIRPPHPAPRLETLIRRPRLGRDETMDNQAMWQNYDYIPSIKISIGSPLRVRPGMPAQIGML